MRWRAGVAWLEEGAAAPGRMMDCSAATVNDIKQ